MEKLGKGKFILIGIMVVLSGIFFVFKGKLEESINKDPQTQEKMKSYVKARAYIVDKDIQKGRRGSTTYYKVQFLDQQGNLQTVQMEDDSFAGQKDSITIYYDPSDPLSTTIGEITYERKK